jgi:hypothetical protein
LISAYHIHTAKCREQGPSTMPGRFPQMADLLYCNSQVYLQQPSLLQQPRHELIQPGFRLDENIRRLDLLYVLLAELDS